MSRIIMNLSTLIPLEVTLYIGLAEKPADHVHRKGTQQPILSSPEYILNDDKYILIAIQNARS